MNFLTGLNPLKKKLPFNSETQYLRSMALIQKKLGNITQKKMLIVEDELCTLCNRYSYPKYEGALTLIKIIDLKKQDHWQSCLEQTFKLARNLGRSSTLSIPKKEILRLGF